MHIRILFILNMNLETMGLICFEQFKYYINGNLFATYQNMVICLLHTKIHVMCVQ